MACILWCNAQNTDYTDFFQNNAYVCKGIHLLPRNVTPPKKVLTRSLKQINLFNSLLQNSDTNCFMEYLVDVSVYNKIKNPLFFFHT